MKIVYFYQYFSTPAGSWGTRVYEFARRWVAEGHHVTVVTSIYYKSDLKASGIVSSQTIDGINVKVLNIHVSNKQNFFQRIFSFIAYVFLSTFYALTLSADVVVASSGPITAGIPGLIAKWFRRRKLIFEVRDLWPEGAIEMNLLRNKWIIKLSYGLEKLCYSTADSIVTLSPGMSDWIRNRYGHENVADVPNASDNALFGSSESNFDSLPAFALKKPFAVYTGNIGEINNSKLLFNTSVYLKNKYKEEAPLIVLIGDGPLKEELEMRLAEEPQDNFILLGLLPKNALVPWIKKATCTLAPLLSKPVLDTSSPNKIFDSLAAGTPVVQTTKGWIKDFLEKHQCGFTVDADDPTGLGETIYRLSQNQQLRDKMGKNAQKVALEQFDRNILSAKMLKVLKDVVSDGK